MLDGPPSGKVASLGAAAAANAPIHRWLGQYAGASRATPCIAIASSRPLIFRWSNALRSSILTLFMKTRSRGL
jgi:hypothetical protein